MEAISKLVLPKGAGTLAVVDTQWGDTGKGKFVDLFAQWADIIARGTGGANAGHTIVIGDKTRVLHLIPSGILQDPQGKVNIIGRGVALDPRILCDEIAMLEKDGIESKGLKLAYNGVLVLPSHLVVDRVKEARAGKGKIGTTGKGIGPAYEDHLGRVGLTVNDLLNPDGFKKKLIRNLERKIEYLKLVDPSIVREVMHHPDLGGGMYYDEKEIFNVDAIVDEYHSYTEIIGDMIIDADAYLQKAHGNKKILLEGAQGILLSIDYGSYPYVTASDCSLRGLTKGVGLQTSDVDTTFSIVKAFYMTRVGEGPFPTELGNSRSQEWCATKTKEDEERDFADASVNSSDEFAQGVGIRFIGNEYGATTGRPRRTGWLDLPMLRYAIPHSSDTLVLTKVDVLNDADTIKVCYAYEYTGEDHRLGERLLKKGDRLEVGISDSYILSRCKPLYKEFPGWKKDITTMGTMEELPQELKDIVSYIEEEAGAKVAIISIGPDRDQTISNM